MKLHSSMVIKGASALAALFLCVASASAQFGGPDFSGQIRDVKNNAQKVTNSVASFLQSQGRWFPQPQGQDMQLCQELNNLQQQLDQLSRDANGRRNPGMLQGELQQVQNTAGRIQGLFGTINPSRDVKRNWSRVTDSLNSAAIAFNSGGGGWNPYNPNPYTPNPYNPYNPYNPNGYRPNPYNPYNPNPYNPNGYNPNNWNSGDFSRAMKRVNSDTQQMVNQLALYFATPGRPGSAPGQDQQLMQELHMFQQQVDTLARDSKNKDPGYLRSQINQLQYRARNVDQLTNQVANNPFVQQKWSSVKNSLDNAYQSFRGGGGLLYSGNGYMQAPENNTFW